MKIKEGCIEDCPWFEAEILFDKTQPAGFKEWCKDITQCRYDVYLPDGSIHDAKLFIDGINRRFKDTEFTNYLLNRYNEL